MRIDVQRVSRTVAMRSLRTSEGYLLVILAATFVGSSSLNAQAPESYTDFRNETIELPLGGLSFVDRVVAQVDGSRKPREAERSAENAIGAPDYRSRGDGNAFTLGCQGNATFEFIDNALVDTPGIDLYVFEVGSDVEPTSIELSKDGNNWTSIGEISGGHTGIDIAEYGISGQSYRFVRLTDAGQFCSGDWPGADIDAIAAVGSALRFELSSNVLFDFDEFELKADARLALDDLTSQLDDLSIASMTIVGHTDSRGSDTYNQELSQRRAESVAQYLRGHSTGLPAVIQAIGLGETEPIEENTTEDGRAKNRRVEILVIPK